MGETLTLSDVCEELVDCVHRTAPETPNGEYFAVGTPAMRGNAINFSEARRISRETFARWTRRLLPKEGDLLLAREAPVGPVVRMPSDGNIAAGQRTMHLRPDPAIVHPRYLFYILISSEFQNRISTLAMGSTVPHLRVADAKTLEMPSLPELSEQQAVADVLGALDDKIAANDRIASLARKCLAAEFSRMGVDSSDAPLKSFLGDVVDLNPSARVPAVSDPVYLEMKNLPDKAMTVTDWGHRAARGGARFQNGDTLLARITPCLENGKVGYVDFLHDSDVGIGSTEFIVLRPRTGIPAVLPYFLASSPRFRDFAIKRMVGSSGRQRLAAADLADYPLHRPEAKELVRFESLSSALMKRVKAAVDESRKLSATRDELLPLLMSGKVRVRDAEKVVEEVV